MTEIILHQWEISPFCNKVRKILSAKGLQWREVNYNGLRARKAASLSPTGKLPVMQHGETTVQDSSKIADFLEKTYPEHPL